MIVFLRHQDYLMKHQNVHAVADDIVAAVVADFDMSVVWQLRNADVLVSIERYHCHYHCYCYNG